MGQGQGQHLLPLLDPYPPERVAGFQANMCVILPLLWNRQRIACLLFREVPGDVSRVSRGINILFIETKKCEEVIEMANYFMELTR